MRPCILRPFILTLLLSLCALAQENRVVHVGVAVMQNKANRSVSGEMERDRLVALLNQEKPDKKLHIKVDAVPLNGLTPEEAADEATQKKCDYVVYTSLLELQSSIDSSFPQRPGTIQTNPGGGLGLPSGGRPLGQEYRVTVDYRLYRAGSTGAIAGTAFSSRQTGDEETAVSQMMNQIANRVFGEIKKSAATQG